MTSRSLSTLTFAQAGSLFRKGFFRLLSRNLFAIPQPLVYNPRMRRKKNRYLPEKRYLSLYLSRSLRYNLLRSN